MIRKVYKNDLGSDFSKKKKNVLSFILETKNGQLPILVISWKLLWTLIKAKLKGKLYFLPTSAFDNRNIRYDFFKLKK